MSQTDSRESLEALLAESLEYIETLEQKLATSLRDHQEPIAVVGAACRYPGHIRSMAQLWRALQEEVEGITVMSNERWDMERFYSEDPDQPGTLYTKSAGLLDDVDQFDAEFFAITPRELKHIDPQHRFLLELAWETFEDAGYAPATMSGTRTGVYVGIMSDDYGQLQGGLAAASLYFGAGISRSCAAGRLAYTFGLEGPTLALDTACSSSLVSVHLAVQALRRKECDTALAGGVNLILSPEGTVVSCRSQMLSRQGHCCAFDARADGFVRSEGCGLVMLKRLSDAVQDKDHIYAVIKGSAVNHDGRSQGFNAPSGRGERKVLKAALADAGLRPGDIDFVECHAVGSKLADPIEVRAVYEAYVQPCTTRKPLVLGTMKANVGHMESAAGIGSLHKAIQALRHREVPGNIHFQNLNPHIDIDTQHISIAREPLTLTEEGALYAGVSAFGFSGTNAHLILENYSTAENAMDTAAEPQENDRVHLFKLSARSAKALLEYAENYVTFLETAPPYTMAAMGYTASTGRSDYPYRIAFSVRQREDLEACLREYVDVAGGDELQQAVPASVSVLWVLGAEQGELWGEEGGNTAAQLYREYRYYRTVVEQACEIIQDRHPNCLRAFNAGIAEPLARTTEAEAVLLQAIHRYALARLLIHCGIKPSVVVGFGHGEYVAAAVAGIISLQTLLISIVDKTFTGDVSLSRATFTFQPSISRGAGASITEAEVIAHLQNRLPVQPLDSAVVAQRVAQLREQFPQDKVVRIDIAQTLTMAFSGGLDEPIFHWVHGNTNRDANTWFENAIASLYMVGLNVNWGSIYEDRRTAKVSLPTYAFQRERHWTEFGFSFDGGALSTVGIVQNITADGMLIDTENAQEGVEKILAEIFKTDKKLDSTVRLLDLGMDSLMALELVKMVRQHFEVDIPISTLMAEMSIGSVVAAIKADRQAYGAAGNSVVAPAREEQAESEYVEIAV